MPLCCKSRPSLYLFIMLPVFPVFTASSTTVLLLHLYPKSPNVVWTDLPLTSSVTVVAVLSDTTVFNAFVASLAVIPLTSTLSIDTPFLIFSSASSEAAHTRTVPIVRITHAINKTTFLIPFTISLLKSFSIH